MSLVDGGEGANPAPDGRFATVCSAKRLPNRGGVMMASIAFVSLTCCYVLPETRGRALRHGRPAEIADIAENPRQSCPA